MVSRLKLFNGLSVSFQRWNMNSNPSLPKVLCLHGWLDNSNSFSYVGPTLAAKGFDVVAMDSIGCGKLLIIVVLSYCYIAKSAPIRLL